MEINKLIYSIFFSFGVGGGMTAKKSDDGTRTGKFIQNSVEKY